MLTTHYLDEADHLADRVAVLAAGRIRAIGDTRALAQIAETPTSISFRGAASASLAPFDMTVEGGVVTIRTREASTVLQQLIRSYGELPDLVVAPPTLEDTYLRLVSEQAMALTA